MEKSIKLNLGCFYKKMYGFINIDARADVLPDVIDDMCKLEKFENNSVDLIYSCHSFEHLDREMGKKTLKRWYDVLKPGGILRLATPDFEKIAAHYLLYRDLKWLSHALNGSQYHEYDMHLMIYDEILLTEVLIEAGFKNIHRYDHNKTEHFYVDDYSCAYYPERHIPDDRTTPKPVLLSLNLECQKP